jgi:hypothetical protein
MCDAVMKISYILVVILLIGACNRIETGDSLTKSDIRHLQDLKVLSNEETIIRFYSEFNKKNAGNFYTNKRIARYWIDDRDRTKSSIDYAYYSDIRSIDTVYAPGLTYCPYMLISKNDGSKFKVCVDGSRLDIKSFFEGALALWREKVGDTPSYSNGFFTAMRETLFHRYHGNKEVFRFLWLRTFHAPICLRLESDSSINQLFIKVTDGRGGYDEGKLIMDTVRKISRSEYKIFIKKLDSLQFFETASILENDGGFDGATWILEGYSNGKYHFINRWSPEDGIFRRCCDYLLQLAQLDIPAKEYY